jgi:hypothetical protein
MRRNPKGDHVETRVDEIAAGVYRISTYVPEADFMFNQFLVDGDEPFLFHTGPRRFFPFVSEALSRVRPLEDLRWITFGHLEADECGHEPVSRRGPSGAGRTHPYRMSDEHRRPGRPPAATAR